MCVLVFGGCFLSTVSVCLSVCLSCDGWSVFQLCSLVISCDVMSCHVCCVVLAAPCRAMPAVLCRVAYLSYHFFADLLTTAIAYTHIHTHTHTGGPGARPARLSFYLSTTSRPPCVPFLPCGRDEVRCVDTSLVACLPGWLNPLFVGTNTQKDTYLYTILLLLFLGRLPLFVR